MAGPPPAPTATPAAILDIATGYMAAKQLFAASRIGVFTALADGARSAAELAEATGVSTRVARILADSMAAQGLLLRSDGEYLLGADARAYLTGRQSDLDLAPFLTFLNEISYGQWEQFDGTVDSDEPGELAMDEDRWATFMAGVQTYNALHARMLADAFDFARFANILDLGGLSSAFSIEALRASSRARATLMVDPASVDSMRADLARSGLAGRGTVVGAETTAARPHGEFDLVMVNHVVHRFGADENIEILRRARTAASGDARVALLDFFLDDDTSQRGLDALHAAEYLVIDGTVVYPEAQVRGWLAEAGWRPVERLTLPASPRVLIAEAG